MKTLYAFLALLLLCMLLLTTSCSNEVLGTFDTTLYHKALLSETGDRVFGIRHHKVFDKTNGFGGPGELIDTEDFYFLLWDMSGNILDSQYLSTQYSILSANSSYVLLESQHGLSLLNISNDTISFCTGPNYDFDPLWDYALFISENEFLIVKHLGRGTRFDIYNTETRETRTLLTSNTFFRILKGLCDSNTVKVISNSDWSVYNLNISSGDITQIDFSYPLETCYSYDKTSIAVESNKDIYIYDVSEGVSTVKSRYDINDFDRWILSLDRSGRYTLYSTDVSICLYDTDTKNIKTIATDVETQIR